jgi:AraC-like DNA-binding protein
MPATRTFVFTDPLSYQAAIRATDIELFPTRKGDFRAELMQIDLDRLCMQRGSESLPAISHAVITEDRLVIEFLVGADQPAFRHNGIDVSPGDMVINDRRLVHRRCFAPHHWGTMSLTRKDLAAATRVFMGREIAGPSITRIVRPTPALMTRLLTLHELTARLAVTVPECFERPEVAKSLEHALVHAMIRCWAEGMSIEPCLRIRNHSAVMARFEDFLAANRGRPAYLAEICAATGVSERTLRACCHEHLGVGPVRYLWLRRMHLARRTLIRADPAAVTVTQIATDHGFGELGRFSVQYRALFGESPSKSLQRAVWDRPRIKNRPLSLPGFA